MAGIRGHPLFGLRTFGIAAGLARRLYGLRLDWNVCFGNHSDSPMLFHA